MGLAMKDLPIVVRANTIAITVYVHNSNTIIIHEGCMKPAINHEIKKGQDTKETTRNVFRVLESLLIITPWRMTWMIHTITIRFRSPKTIRISSLIGLS